MSNPGVSGVSAISVKSILPSEFYALTQGVFCEGDVQCYYCTAPCKRLWLHQEPPPVPYSRSKSMAKKPDSPWQCHACWLWNRKRVTIDLLSEGFKDGQCLLHHSTLITPEKVLACDLPKAKEKLYGTLLSPPLEFSLSLLEGDNQKNLIQHHILNVHNEIKASTELHFTVNNIPHTYTVHELEETLEHGDNGRMPGARAIYRLLGPVAKAPGENIEQVKQKLRRGRPTNEERAARGDNRDGKQDRVIKADKTEEKIVKAVKLD
jgi:hypothetical protein